MKRLSLLSRGKCEVVQSSPRQFEVTLEPHDFRTDFEGFHSTSVRSFADNPICMPVQRVYRNHPPLRSREATLPKTYLTKKGALLLYSEDFARFHGEITQREEDRNGHRRHQINISTADLALAVSRYEESQNKYNRFLRDRLGPDVMPGHSARRHVHAWHLSHPELGSLGPRLTNPDRRTRKRRTVRTHLSVIPTPYNLPKSLNQIKSGRRSLEKGSPEREPHSQTMHSMWSPGVHSNNIKHRMPSIHNPRTVPPVVVKRPPRRQSTRPPTTEPHGTVPDGENGSSLSSEVKFTRTLLPSIYKDPSLQRHKPKDGLNGMRSPGGNIIARKKVRIRLDPVIVPNTDSPEPG